MRRQSRHSRRLLTALAAASLLTTMVMAAAGPASASPGSGSGSGGATSGPVHRATPAPMARPGSLAQHLDLTTAAGDVPAEGGPAVNRLRLHGTGPQAVFVQLAGASGTQTSRQKIATTRGSAVEKEAAAKTAVRQVRQSVAARANALAELALGAKATPTFVVSNALRGFAITATPAQLRRIASQPDVVKISAIVPKHPDNAHTAQLTRVLNAWQDTGVLGEGVKVGIIDTGIDYTHADFGGPGTEQAYQDAFATSDDFYSTWQRTLTAGPRGSSVKIGGGWDFAGNDYDANPTNADGSDNPNYQPVPHPDPDPLDCNSHGTHVAGTIAGWGENADGSTFSGDYAALTGQDLDGMRIGPGMAPSATLFSFKVFGCQGSTDVVIPALDYSLDPNGDGDFSDRMDIVNLSLGSDYSTPDDPENDVVNALAAAGVLPVIAMGNGGDLTDIGGSPGNAVRSLAVASSVDSFQLLSGVRVTAPAADAGVAYGQVSQDYGWAAAPDVTGAVAELSAANADGCDALSAADAAAVKGKIAWLTWDSNDATRRCGSVGRAGNVAAAGAIGALFTGDVPVFASGISGSKTIPVVQLTLTETTKLKPAADAGTLAVTFTASLVNNQGSDDPSLNDLVSSFSSRGTHGSIGVVKPDVTAPGDTIVSAGMATGNGVLVDSGTSMATPHTAGIAALVKARHAGWTPEQLKAAIMNTAGHDLYSGAGQSGDVFGPNRVGAGRVDALDAVTTSVLAYSADVAGGVSASFGVVEVPVGKTVSQQRHVTVRNTGSAPATLALSYAAAVDEPGVSYSVSPSSVTVVAGEQAAVTVTLTAVSDQLRHTIDPTMAVEQGGNARQYVSDASGRLIVSQQGRDDLRVPVYGAVKPVSAMTAQPGGIDDQTAVVLSGSGFGQGDPGDPTSWASLASVMQFGAESPRLPACADATETDCTLNQTAVAGDIQYVGAGIAPDESGSLADGYLWFGISTYGNWATVGNSTVPYVDIDTDGDGEADYEVYAQNVSGTDVLVAWLVDAHTGELVDAQPVNFALGDVDTNVFDSNTLLLPVSPKAIGITDGTTSFPLTYTVGTNSYYTNNDSHDIDEVGPVAFDAGAPKVAVDGGLWLDQPGSAVPVTVSGPATTALVFHLHNASGSRAETVTLSPFHGFTDIAPDYHFYDDVAFLAAAGITTGYPDHSYRPGGKVTRSQMAGFLYRLLHPGAGDATCTGATRTFVDVPAGAAFCGDIEWLAAQGITKVPTSKRFDPSGTVTRQQMAMFLYRVVTGMDDADCAAGDRTFTDVPAGSAGCGDVEWLAAHGIVNGYPGGTYRPAAVVLRGQMAAFLHRAWTYRQSQ